MKIVPDLINSLFFRFCKHRGFAGRGRRKGVFFEEETNFVARGQEVGVSDVGGGFAG